ncbi:MAG: STAS/SEC14 domain-containing protein [Actinomycetota bacterium]|nr:STAS/SEC14 domain-containing protein [Actinomycetota bacterium]
MTAEVLPEAEHQPAANPATVTPMAGGGISIWMAPEGILRIKLPELASITGPQAEAAAALVRSLANGRLLPLLMDVTGVLSVTSEMREVYGRSVAVSACALLGKSPVDRVIAHHFLGAESSGLPAAYFTSESEAIAWLEERRSVG